MQVREIKTNKERKEYIDFIYKVYKNDKNFCDMNLLFVKSFLYQKERHTKRLQIIPVMIKDDGIKLVCMFVIDETNEVKLSFLEFLPNSQKYLKALIQYAKGLLKIYKKKKVIVGVNGQISYGLGILTNKYNQKFEFNANYNRDYYTKELDQTFTTIKRAYSYEYQAKHVLNFFDEKMLENTYKKYQFRFLDVKYFKRDMLIFGKLAHESLKATPYYSAKTDYEMYELMKQLKFIMKKEDIIFAMKNGKEVGFVFNHPDYAELFDRPKLNYIRFYLRYLFKKPKRVIYNVIGVLPGYQLSGIAAALIHKAIVTRKDIYTEGVSSFILEDNIPSTKLSRKLSTGINKEYHLYELEGDDDA